jgi:5-(carboxyamino)imidazole ribonucleotide mutase
VATVSIGGARNAGLLAVRILASFEPGLAEKMARFQQGLAETALSKNDALVARRRNLGK